jgi:ring-1,2-phenylacetyl-CoA epoxidase subunit PaaE
VTLDPHLLGKPLKVVRRVQETPEAVSLAFEIPPEQREKFQYQAGQFVTFFMTIDGETLNRSYSISSSPAVDDEFRVTIKKVHGGRGSTYLCERVKEGDVLLTAPPAGQFFKPASDPKGVHYYLYAAGSGITPVYSILKTVLTSSALNRVTLVFSNRFETAIIYQRELEQWAQKYPTRLDVLHLISKPSDAWAGRTGRLSRELIAEVLESPTEHVTREHYVCGPTDFMALIKSSLKGFGVADEHVRSEDFAISLPKEKIDLDAGWTFIGDQSTPEKPATLKAEINGEWTEVPAKEGQSILETLLEAGADPPYSCMNGSCMACLAKITEGRVYQEDPGILTDDNIEAGEMLTCQAKCLSKIVKFSYDAL